MTATETLQQLRETAQPHLALQPERPQLLVGVATCANAAGARKTRETLAAALAAGGLTDEVDLVQVGCVGRCSLEPLVEVRMPDEPPRMYTKVDERRAEQIVRQDIAGGKPIAAWLLDEGERLGEPARPVEEVRPGQVNVFTRDWQHVDFFQRQLRIALRNVGRIDPEEIDDYLAIGGYAALAKVLDGMTPEGVIASVTDSKLRGRGGAGFPTGLKWKFTRAEEAATKYVICNADEGDPGAFMDRSTLEGDPHSVLEAMIIAGFAIGAEQGYVYVRAEYPLAIRRLERAIEQARERGILGESVLGTEFAFDIDLRLGAGAFVCGEETALIASIEGKRGMPRPRPPYPSVSGLWGRPTCINNVETLASIPAIILNGADWFAGIGTEGSTGTKVFALAGNVNNTGLVEVPMGVTLREIIFDLGGGVPEGRKFKAAQTGGPSGGCLSANYLDTPIDYDSLREAGAIMGSGGLIVMDDTSCMVDIAKFFLTFTQDESCGRCTPCREGTRRMLEILERITLGKGEERDFERLQRLCDATTRASLCGLGQTAANPVLSTLRHFGEEYQAHIVDHSCPAHTCKSLLHYEVDAERCVGCGLCKRVCPVHCIVGEPREEHTITSEVCTACGACYEACKFDAIIRS
ncbi:MAG: NADH-quinone oxidoreductase subunit NuoF [Armatimonadota bacterium]|jgi:NADH:ubiquinone oxidoreductase subunit F (NADH-binding)/(2Fe-2S) ferredoxin